MKRFLIVLIAVIFITVFIPFAVVMLMSKTIDNSEPFNSSETAEFVKIYIPSADAVIETDKLTYLTGVTAAEMPAEFETEALKAQAVAARTYLAAHMRSKRDSTHKGADICANPSHCQAWVSESDFKASRSAELWDKVKNAVKDTEKEVITYKGNPISAVFFSTSSGITENASDVWGNEVPYLKSVKSCGDELSPYFSSSVSYSEEDFRRIAEESIENTIESSDLFGNLRRTKAGGISAIEICGAEISGTQLRSIYGLRSTNAEISYDGEFVNFTVKGFGHNVGMSQYGASYLAADGKNYKYILKHYYSGIKIERQ